MMCVPTEIRPSSIQGLGVFLLVPVKKGDVIWRFDSRVDRIYSSAEIESLPSTFKKYMKTYAWWYKPADVWILCGDQGSYVNHSVEPNLTCIDGGFGIDIAAYDLAAGVELTSDYNAFCDHTRETGEL